VRDPVGYEAGYEPPWISADFKGARDRSLVTSLARRLRAVGPRRPIGFDPGRARCGPLST